MARALPSQVTTEVCPEGSTGRCLEIVGVATADEATHYPYGYLDA